MLLRSELFCIFYFFKGEIRAYFGASFLFFDLFALSVSTSLMTFFIGEAVSFIGSVMGGLSLRSSLLLLRKKKLIYQSKLFPLHRHFCQFFFQLVEILIFSNYHHFYCYSYTSDCCRFALAALHLRRPRYSVCELLAPHRNRRCPLLA